LSSAVGEFFKFVHRVDDPLSQEESGNQIKIFSGCPHRDCERLDRPRLEVSPGDTNLKWLFDGETIFFTLN
jgi:hypothetical protein